MYWGELTAIGCPASASSDGPTACSCVALTRPLLSLRHRDRDGPTRTPVPPIARVAPVCPAHAPVCVSQPPCGPRAPQLGAPCAPLCISLSVSLVPTHATCSCCTCTSEAHAEGATRVNAAATTRGIFRSGDTCHRHGPQGEGGGPHQPTRRAEGAFRPQRGAAPRAPTLGRERGERPLRPWTLPYGG